MQHLDESIRIIIIFSAKVEISKRFFATWCDVREAEILYENDTYAFDSTIDQKVV